MTAYEKCGLENMCSFLRSHAKICPLFLSPSNKMIGVVKVCVKERRKAPKHMLLSEDIKKMIDCLEKNLYTDGCGSHIQTNCCVPGKTEVV